MPNLKRSAGSDSLQIMRFCSLFMIMALCLSNVPGVVAAPLYDPTPSVELRNLGDALMGEQVEIQIAFLNTGDDPGFGPFIDLILPTTGEDGEYPFDPGFEADGLSFLNATFLGAGLTTEALTFPEAPGCVDHPYAVESDGSPVEVCGTPGDQLVVIQLPFGSYVPEQPEAVVTVTLDMSDWADLDEALSISARSGFQYGWDALDNPASDPSVLGAYDTGVVTPVLLLMEKTYIGPEDETATGPNFPRRYTIDVNLAAGQSVTNLEITDFLPPNMAYLSLISSSPGGAALQQAPTVGAAANPPANDLVVGWAGPLTGTTADVDATLTFEYFIPQYTADGDPVIEPASGDDVSSPDSAEAQADWDPEDDRDDPTTVVASQGTVDHILIDKSIAIQKHLANLSAAPYSPDDVLEYSLEFQISDYFAFDNLVIIDLLSDGQHFDPTFTPTLSINGNGFSLSALAMDSDNYDVIPNYSPADPVPNDGTTQLVFRVSAEIITRGQTRGMMVGGCVPPAGTGEGDPDCSVHNDNGTIGTLIYHALIQDEFTDTYPSGDPSVDQGDVLDNALSINADLLSVTDTDDALGTQEADDSDEDLVIPRGEVQKSIYAINGDTGYSDTRVAPGDTITFRVQYGLETSDVEDLVVTDYLPLPILDATEVAAGNFDDVVDGTVPSAGRTKFGPSDTFRAYSGIVPGLSSDGDANSVSFSYGDFDDARELSRDIDLLFTVTVTADPFADGLYLTNQAEAYEGSTNADDASQNAIIQFQITEPVLEITKGIVSGSNPNADIDPPVAAPITFGGGCPSFSGGTINSNYLAATPLDGDMSGVDAGDNVIYTIVIENTGRGLNGAFDVQLRDSLPAGLTTADFAAGSLCVTDGTGAPIAYDDLGGGGETDLFGPGIELIDPGPTDPPSGALDPGKDADGNPIGSGRNIAVITYQVVLPASVEPLQTYTNTATLFNYAGEEGGPDHTATDLSDDAVLTVLSPQVLKSIFATDQAHTVNEPPPPPQVNVAIGEILTYQTEITVPEGTSTDIVIQDTLDPGLAFVDCVSIEASPILTTTIGDFSDACDAPTNPTIDSWGSGPTAPGRRALFNLGTIVNNDRNNGTPETITLTYTVVVLNSEDNDAGDQRNNNAQWQSSFGSVGDSAPNVRIYEPHLQVTKEADPTSGDAGDTITYTLTIEHPSVSPDLEAFEAVLTDELPDDATYQAATLNCAALDTSLVPDFCAISGSPLTLHVDWASFPLGEKTVIQFDVTLDASVTPGQVVTNTADLTWTSLPGETATASSDYNDLSYERTGDPVDPGGVANDHAASADAPVDIIDATSLKVIVASSEAHTGDATADTQADPRPLAVGEIVRYHLRATLPEGTIPDFALVDVLPDGMQLLEDDTAMVSFLADSDMNEPLDLSGADNDADPPTFSLPGGRISTDGQEVTFSLGTLINNDRDAGAEQVLLEFNALVLNSADAVRGTDLENSFSLEIGGVTCCQSDSVWAQVMEPTLRVQKVADPTEGDAGDRIEFTVTIDHDPSSDASSLDVEFVDDLPAGYALDLGSVSVVLAGGASGDVDASSGNQVLVRVAEIPLGGSVTITYDGVLQTSVEPGQTLNNVGDLSWTSLPGEGTESNPTGSDTPGASGAADGERDGSGGVNDYETSDDADVTSPPAEFEKSLTETSADHTGVDQHDPALDDLTIGETATFHLTVTLPEGTITGVTVTDDLPDVLSIVRACAHAVGGNLSGAGLPGALCPSSIGALDDVNYVDGLPDQVLIDLGTVVNSPDGTIDSDDRIVFEIVARVENNALNQDLDQPINQAELAYGSTTLTDSVQVDLVEPDLLITKTADDNAPAFEQILTYTVLVEHSANSSADAFDLQIVDTLPDGLTYVSGSASLPPAQVNESGYPPVVVYTIPSLNLADGSFSFTYQARVGDSDSVDLRENLDNTAGLTWTSLPGDDDHERTGEGVDPQDDYAGSDDERVTVTGPDLRVLKDDGGYEATPGDVVVYTITFENAGNSVATGVVLRETVPDNSVFDAANSDPGWSCADGAIAGTECTLTTNLPAGAGIVPVGEGGSVDFAVRLPVTMPAGVDQIDNTVRIADDSSHGPDPTPEDNTAEDDTPVEASPDLDILKDDGLDAVSPGEVLIFTLNFSNSGDQTATGVDLQDEVPPNTTFYAADSSVGWDCSDGDPPGTTCTLIPDIGYGQGVLPAGEAGSVEFALQVDDPFPSGVSTVLNTVYIADDGSNGDDPTPGNNYDDDQDYVLTMENVDLQKVIVATSEDFSPGLEVAIGELLTYEITLTVPPGTLENASVLDVLDQGLAFLDCVEILPETGEITTSLGNFDAACDPNSAAPALGNPSIAAEPSSSGEGVNQGRRILFDLGDISNSGSEILDLVLRYQVVVLDSADNVSGEERENQATWTWTGGALQDHADPVQMIEPTLTLLKTVSRRVAPPGRLITFTLEVAHDDSSDADAFDLVLEDIVPNGLIYEAGSLRWTGEGLEPNSLVESGAPTLQFIWDHFPLAGRSVVEFQARMGQLPADRRVLNVATLAWTSLPLDSSDPQSDYNDLSTERHFDPPSSVDIYGTQSEIDVRTPKLPETGFAPDANQPMARPEGDSYHSLGSLWLEIPKLDLRSTIVGVPMDDQGWDLRWLWNQAGYLEDTAFPAHAGNTALTAHVLLPNGIPGPFNRLNELFWGDTIYVRAGERTYEYQVREVRRVWPHDLSVLQHEEYDWLTLITCREFSSETQTYLSRLVVRAVLVAVR